MMGLRRWSDRRLHLWAFVHWGWNVVQLFSDLHDAIEAGDRALVEKRLRGVEAVAKRVYLKGKFHAYRGPGKLLWFKVWLRSGDTSDPLGLVETPEQRRVKWNEPA